MEKNDIYKNCPNCNILFDLTEHLPRILPQCNHTLCTSCITTIFFDNSLKKIICPIDKVEYDNINNINSFETNKIFIENIKNNNGNSSADAEVKDNSDKKLNGRVPISKNDDIILNTSISYDKIISQLRKIVNKNNNQNSCEIHSLPMNIICIDERKKICSQCALNDIHSTHQIITEKDFLFNINKLIDLFQEIDNNQIKYLSINISNNVKNIISDIDNNILQLIDLIQSTKEKIIKNINNQCEKIINFLNKRKNEIEKKFQNNNFDMNNLRETALSWMQNVADKLNKINENNIDLIKLIDNGQEKEKDISNLISSGKQLKDRYIFAQESVKIINDLEEFKNTGIKIEPNIKILNNIFDFNISDIENDSKLNSEINNKESNKDIENNNKKENIEIDYKIEDKKDNNISKKNESSNIKDKIKITLFNVEERYELINLLHLEHSEFNIKQKPKPKIYDDINNNTNEKIKSISPNKRPDKSLINLDEINIDEDTLLISSSQRCMSNENESNNTKSTQNIQNFDGNKKVQDFYKKFVDYNENLNNMKEIENKNEINKNINNNIIRKSNGIINKKIICLNNINRTTTTTRDSVISKSNINFNKSKNKCNNEIKNMSTIKEIHIKNRFTNSLYRMNYDDTPHTSYSRSPPNRRIKIKYSTYMPLEDKTNSREVKFDNCQSLISNGSIKKEKKIKVELNNKMNYNLYKNKENRNVSNFSVKKNNVSINKANNLTKKASKENLSNLNNIFIASYNRKNLNNYGHKLNLRNHPSKKSFSSLYSEQNNFESNNNNNITNSDITKDENKEKIKIDVFNHYNSNCMNNKENINIMNINESNSNQTILKKNIVNAKRNESYETKNKNDLKNFVLAQMKNLSPNFSRINMKGIGMQLVCSFLHKNPNNTYKEMKFLGCNLVDDDLFLLIRTLLDHNINLIILNLSNNKITDDSASNILDLVKEHKTLKGLSLYNNLISDILKEKLKEYTELGRENFEDIQLYI